LGNQRHTIAQTTERKGNRSVVFEKKGEGGVIWSGRHKTTNRKTFEIFGGPTRETFQVKVLGHIPVLNFIGETPGRAKREGVTGLSRRGCRKTGDGGHREVPGRKGGGKLIKLFTEGLYL